MRTVLLATILIAVLGLSIGCAEEPSVGVYETPLPAGVGVVQGPVVIDGLEIDPPTGWRDFGATSMLLAKYRSADGAELTVSQASGALIPNINRWRRQLGLAPLSQQIDPLLVIDDVLETPAGAVAVIDIADSEDDPMANRFRIGVIMEVRDGQATGRQWFFKLSGPASVIDQHRQTFDQMLLSLRLTQEEVQSDG